MKRLVFATVLIIAALILGAQLKAQAPTPASPLPKFQGYKMIRPDLKDQGFGWMINDLERHSHPGHPMRNESDPGNWVHELTHQVNSDIRGRTKENDNAFYVMKGRYVLLNEPKVTLKQVAKLVPEKDQGPCYKGYLILQQRYWNNEPLYILDEATSFANALQYHVDSETRDQTRYEYANEFISYIDTLVLAIERHDPGYTQLGELREYVEWHRSRIQELSKQYQEKTE